MFPRGTTKKSEVQKNVEAFFKELFSRVIPRDFPFMGVCSGNGLLGNYYGYFPPEQADQLISALSGVDTPVPKKS